MLIKILFELTHFFKLRQNVVKNRIHFNASLRGAFIQGLVTGCCYNRTKKAFQNKLQSNADQNSF